MKTNKNRKNSDSSGIYRSDRNGAGRRSLDAVVSRKWCRHIKWTTTTYGWKTYYFREGRNDDAWVEADSWVCCPLCLAKHPKLKAAKGVERRERTTTPRMQERRDGGVLMQRMVRRFACPQHFDTNTELECLLCMSMPTIFGTSADYYEVSFDGARACVQTESGVEALDEAISVLSEQA